MRIGIDLFGGDDAPVITYEAAVKFANDFPEIKVVIFGTVKADQIAHQQYPNISIVETEVAVKSSDIPTIVVKAKRDSSMALGALALKEKKIDGFITAGNTGAAVTSGIFLTGRIPGIERPMLGTICPGNTLLLDIGANSQPKISHMVDQAKVGAIYMREVMNIVKPRVGLLNIGAESNKGNDFYKEVYEALEKDPFVNFIGNIEPRYVLNNHDVDVVVCDGFTGNIVLKTLEGATIYVIDAVKSAIMRNPVTKLAGLTLKGTLKENLKDIDSEQIGGTVILGVNGLIIKAHGSSTTKAFYNTMLTSVNIIKQDISQVISEEFIKMEAEGKENDL